MTSQWYEDEIYKDAFLMFKLSAGVLREKQVGA